MPVEIELTRHNYFMAGPVGVSPHVKGAYKQGRYGAGNAEGGWPFYCDGACGEMSVAKWLNVFYDGALGNFAAKDVGAICQVRTTPYANGCLLLHPGDHDEDRFILVLAHKAPRYVLRGWLLGRDGKQQQWWPGKNPDRPAFWVPQSELKSMDTFFR